MRGNSGPMAHASSETARLAPAAAAALRELSVRSGNVRIENCTPSRSDRTASRAAFPGTGRRCAKTARPYSPRPERKGRDQKIARNRAIRSRVRTRLLRPGALYPGIQGHHRPCSRRLPWAAETVGPCGRRQTRRGCVKTENRRGYSCGDFPETHLNRRAIASLTRSGSKGFTMKSFAPWPSAWKTICFWPTALTITMRASG